MKRTIKVIIILISVVSVFAISAKAQPVIAENPAEQYVILGGEPFGIRMFSRGLLVIDVEDTLLGLDVPSPAKKADIRKNDIILSVNNEQVNSNEELAQIVNEINKESLTIELLRDEKSVYKKVYPQADSQGYLRLGLWVKDSAAGIGTITYFDTQTNTLGALGHGICESETGILIPLEYGEIAKAEIHSVTKSENGNVGSLNGYFNTENIGTVVENTNCGIFGKTYEEIENSVKIPLAKKSDVHTGDAKIYCTVNGSDKKEFDIKIRRLRVNFEDTMLIEITDKELLDITGGIVQGMSGSPIVQDGKLVGAVTHVLVNNVKCGYGLYIEDMVYESKH